MAKQRDDNQTGEAESMVSAHVVFLLVSRPPYDPSALCLPSPMWLLSGQGRLLKQALHLA